MTEPVQQVPWWIKALLTAILAVLGTLVTINYSFYKSDKVDIVGRVSAIEAHQQKLEAHQDNDHETLNHIQAQVDKLVEWALGEPRKH